MIELSMIIVKRSMTEGHDQIGQENESFSEMRGRFFLHHIFPSKIEYTDQSVTRCLLDRRTGKVT